MLRLLLPALIPSWRFFDRIGPAPRIDYALSETPDDVPAWNEVRPRPAHLSIGTVLARLFWNRRRNEALYLVSCAERLVEEQTQWRARELWTRVADIVREESGASARIRSTARTPHRTRSRWLRVRIVESMREGAEVVSDVVYESAPKVLDDSGTEADA